MCVQIFSGCPFSFVVWSAAVQPTPKTASPQVISLALPKASMAIPLAVLNRMDRSL